MNKDQYREEYERATGNPFPHESLEPLPAPPFWKVLLFIGICLSPLLIIIAIFNLLA